MNVQVSATPDAANTAAADLLAAWLAAPDTRQVMLAAGNTPLALYRLVASRGLALAHLHLHALDEYVGVPPEEPRNCANLIRRTAAEPWGVPAQRYFTVSSVEADALASVQRHEARIAAAGGLDVLVLGLGQNGHLGFNEPGSTEETAARVLDLDPISVEANRQWFGGNYAPARGATVGMKTILAARRILLLAFGPHKTGALQAMLEGPRTPQCPASLLQGHPATEVLVDTAAAAGVRSAVLRPGG
ncbi:MAG: 6-phosphogluconolactonase [Limisphaerales bacterium]